MSIINILLVILIIAASALCIALIIYLWKITQSIKAMQADVDELSKNLQPLINTTSKLADDISKITDSAKDQIDMSKDIVVSVKDRVDTILEFEENVRKGIEGPVMTFIREITAINKGLNTFLSYFRKK
ncbi:hypothetical protein BMS3Abin03_00638 [bacterium BMS3Abin03]|nr:hypothetical protein BMS3Abin03_00638 [bacterium BMS3Abin03]